jgi:lactoylglutathione lyase
MARACDFVSALRWERYRRLCSRATAPLQSTPKIESEITGMVKKLLHTRYRVQDLPRTVSFYKEVLGLEEVRRSTSPRGSQLVFFKAPGSEEMIEITKYDASGPVVVGPDLTHLAFEVDDLEAFAKHAASKGYPLSDGPTQTSSGSVIAFIDAPEGYEIELIQPAK